MVISKRGIQISLGLLWLLDGLLQLQPKMFTKKFANQVIGPATQGQPGFVRSPIHFGIHIFLTQTVVFNSLFALTQLTIGGLILYKRSAKWGLRLSVVWGLVVWIFGEAYGGIFSGHTLLLMGAPGAALIYVLISLAVMPKNDEKEQSTFAYWLVIVWAIFWTIGGIYQLLPGQNTTSDISSMISINESSVPRWLASIDRTTSRLVKDAGGTTTQQETASQMNMTATQMDNMTSPAPVITMYNPGYWLIILFSLIQILVGILALFDGLLRKTAIALGIILSLVFWVIGQSIGSLYSGLATDPGTAPLFILLGLAILGQKDINKRLSQVSQYLKHLLIGAR